MDEILETFASWRRCLDRDRKAAAARVASALGHFRLSPEPIGPDGLFELVDTRSKVPFVLVPGGTFEMGFRESEIDELHRIAELDAASSGYPFWGPISARVIAAATPATPVTVAPFLCARTPVLDLHVRPLDGKLVGRCPLEIQPETTALDAPVEPTTMGIDPADVGEGDLDGAALFRPAMLDAQEAVRVSQRLHARLIREAEWEFTARTGGVDGWCACDPTAVSYTEITRSIEELAASPLFRPGPARDRASNALGVWALHIGEWVVSGTDPRALPRASRGGGALSWPWQDSEAVLFVHPAVRHAGAMAGKYSAVRLALDLPPAS